MIIMNKRMLDKTTRVEDNLVIITEKTETKLNEEQLEHKLRDVRMQKLRIKEQNARLVEDYNKLLEEENEINELMLQLGENDGVEVI